MFFCHNVACVFEHIKIRKTEVGEYPGAQLKQLNVNESMRCVQNDTEIVHETHIY